LISRLFDLQVIDLLDAYLNEILIFEVAVGEQHFAEWIGFGQQVLSETFGKDGRGEGSIVGCFVEVLIEFDEDVSEDVANTTDGVHRVRSQTEGASRQIYGFQLEQRERAKSNGRKGVLAIT
jgi:hypothetical protein